MMNNNYVVMSNDNNNPMIYANTMPNPPLHIETPVVKSHNIHSPPNYPPQQQTMETTNIMGIDDFFMPHTLMDNNTPLLDNSLFIYSPLSTSITTNNSSIMMMDTAMSPTSPINYSATIDPFIAAAATPNYMYPEPPVVPTNVHTTTEPHKSRRHTVSLPYPNIVDTLPPPPTTKSRKSSLKAKRHRSLGKLNDPVSLENWTHEQLLERVKELEKEKEQTQQKQNKVDVSRSTSRRSASQTDTEVEDDEDDEDGPHVCKWDTCTLEYNTLNDLINHVKLDHIGSGKGSYYCCWKDCVRKQKPFTKKHKMHNHLRTHTGERPFACEEPDCGKRFSRPDSLTTHAKIHSNIRPYLCSVVECGKAYFHLRSLRKHEKSHMDPPPLPVAPQTDWGLSAQAAVFDVMDHHITY